MNTKTENAAQIQNIELTAQEIKHRLPLMLQHVITFYEKMLPNVFVGEEKLKQIKVIDWAYMFNDGREMIPGELDKDIDIYVSCLPQISAWQEFLQALSSFGELTDENFSKSALGKSRILFQPLLINGVEQLQPREYYVERFMKTLKEEGIH